LGNLLANAVKYSPDGGEIAVEIAREDDSGRAGRAAGTTGGWAVVRVRDRGVGIPAEDRERIFGQFERGSNVGKIAGTGLGLAAARQIVALHGGTVHVESAVGSGSTFTVRLPLDAEGEAR
jgi:signal transduction histidine kinase